MNVVLYTVAGSITSVAVGYGLGVVGDLTVPAGALAATVGAAVLVAVALLVAARELGRLRLPLWQPRRQTDDRWARTHGLRPAAVLWGLDIGATLTTRFTFGGTWVLVLLPVAAADPTLGTLTLLACWLGRAAPVWLVPPLVGARVPALAVLDAVAARHRVFRDSHLAGIALVVSYVSYVGWSAL